jgi:hypothetical protein
LVTLVAAPLLDELDFADGFLGEIFFSATFGHLPSLVPGPSGLSREEFGRPTEAGL